MTKNLAQMTEKERAECCGMWVNTPLGYGVLVDNLSMNGYHEPVVLIASYAKLCDGRWDWDQLDLRPNLPRAWEMDGLPNRGLAPDLPDPEIEYKDGGACWLDSDTTSVESQYDSDSDEFIITTGVAYDLTPTEAKQLAYALLAAAQWAEKEPSWPATTSAPLTSLTTSQTWTKPHENS